MKFSTTGIYIIKKDFINKELLLEVKKTANPEFTSALSEEMHRAPYLPELPKGLLYSNDSGVNLKVKNVQPHKDFSVGSLKSNFSLFGVLSDPGPDAYLQVNSVYTPIRKGYWYLFNDRLLHSVQSTRTFFCVAVQVKAGKDQDASEFEHSLYESVYEKPRPYETPRTRS